MFRCGANVCAGLTAGVLWLLAGALPACAQESFTGVQRVVAVGDVHGGYEEFVAVLRFAGIIDSSNRWSGGSTHLVQTGDVLDRGAHSRQVLELLMALEGEAKRAKGRVHVLLGNHEAMNMYGDLRYVSAGEYASYQTSDSAKLQRRAYDQLADPARKSDAAYQAQWMGEHPLGWAEHRQSFSSGGRFGKYLRNRPAIVKINDSLFLHGGISAKYAADSLADLNKKIRAELNDFSKLEGGIAMDPEGPLWYRGLASAPEAELAGLVDQILTAFGVARVVVGHTPTMGAVVPRFGGRVLMIDVGLSKLYNDSPACLLIENGKPFALHRGTRLELPASGGDVAGYLERASKLDPPKTKLREYVDAPR